MFRAVGGLCAVDMEELNVPVSHREALSILGDVGFQEVSVSLAEIAEAVTGAEYRRAARLSEAPRVFDCSSLTKWLYGQIGVWIPRRSIQQYCSGTAVDLTEAKMGDLAFTEGFMPYFDKNPADGIGHVGMVLPGGHVVQAANKKDGVVVSPISAFTKAGNYRGIRRIVSDIGRIVVLRTPSGREVETSDDIKWIIYQQLP